MDRSFLVTGGAGFIGSNFVRYLSVHEPDARVVNLDNLSHAGGELTLRDLEHSRHTFVNGDIRDTPLMRELMSEADVVVNFAARTHVDHSIEAPLSFVETNVLGTAVLIEEAAKQSVDLFIQVSTDEVYGPIDQGCADERAPLAPSSPYAASKAAADLVIQSYARTYGYESIITRCTNNYGPYQFPDKVVPLFVTNLLQQRHVPLYGDGHNERDWIHVQDHCAAIHLLTTHGTRGEIYNIGTGVRTSNLALTRTVLESLGVDESVIDNVEDRPGHDSRYAVDSSKVRALGWEPVWALHDGLEETLAWYRERENWWRPLVVDS